jgi:hypothetical protein
VNFLLPTFLLIKGPKFPPTWADHHSLQATTVSIKFVSKIISLTLIPLNLEANKDLEMGYKTSKQHAEEKN